MADTVVKPTDPAAEHPEDVKNRADALSGRESPYKRGEITSATDDESVPTGHGGIRHFDGTIVKLLKNGERVLSSFVNPEHGERLAGEVDEETDAARTARTHEPKDAAGKKVAKDEGVDPGSKKADDAVVKPSDAPNPGAPGQSGIVRTLP